MGQAAASSGDTIVATDIHIVLIPAGRDLVQTEETLPFNGVIDNGMAGTVTVEGRPAATIGSGASNLPPHVPIGGSFETPPTNRATIVTGSATVLIEGKGAARQGDTAKTCNDPEPEPVGTVVAASSVLIGD